MLGHIKTLRGLLEHPLKVLIAAMALALASLLAEGSLINLWNLKTEKQKLMTQYEVTKMKNTKLQSQIKKAQSSDRFIGHEAREKLDLVSEDELIFIFDN